MPDWVIDGLLAGALVVGVVYLWAFTTALIEDFDDELAAINDGRGE